MSNKLPIFLSGSLKIKLPKLMVYLYQWREILLMVNFALVRQQWNHF